MEPAAADLADGRTAEAARAVVEQLEMLWERGRDAVPTAPVSTSQLRVLYTLDQQDGINLRDLGRQIGAAPSSASRLCDRLQAIGYLHRSFSSTDRREVTLRITSLGRAYLSELRAHREEELASTLAAMTAQERDALMSGLAAFRKAHDAATARAAARASAAPSPEPGGEGGERPADTRRAADLTAAHHVLPRTA
ncbi:MarR family winged helix-turn-helix transcriptional regulator [Streptomyces sp. NPDC087440]|uniref:MarR family winged helix-turn-helix transcriptional regulator n=1 Tax=Streptomyces sp. NPDC087440 TaxID=3365790 RepID=UPI00380B9C34